MEPHAATPAGKEGAGPSGGAHRSSSQLSLPLPPSWSPSLPPSPHHYRLLCVGHPHAMEPAFPRPRHRGLQPSLVPARALAVGCWASVAGVSGRRRAARAAFSQLRSANCVQRPCVGPTCAQACFLHPGLRTAAGAPESPLLGQTPTRDSGDAIQTQPKLSPKSTQINPTPAKANHGVRAACGHGRTAEVRAQAVVLLKRGTPRKEAAADLRWGAGWRGGVVLLRQVVE